MKNIDIIIPVYNAYDYTFDCIKSVIKYTDLENNRLIVINDKSPDQKILPMLNEFLQNNPKLQIVVLNNKENLGFVKTVNLGMSYSQNDIVLLNSDTEVTVNWLKKLQVCAYSNLHIASVTPFTNNGAICSIPNFGVDNELPPNMSLEEYAELIEKISNKKYPEISTAVGFCMFIKRIVIDEIGLFDDITFGKGYGEENDFCYRALDYGYIHVLADDTFVYHKGTQSFTEQKSKLIKEHMKLLTSRYPVYVHKTDMFIASNPLKEINQNIQVNIELYNKRKVLYLIHEWDEDLDKLTGGTSLHLKDIVKNIKDEIACFVLCPDKYNFQNFKLYIYNANYDVRIYEFKISMNYSIINYTNSEYKEMVSCIIKNFGIDIIHIQHLLHHTFDIVDLIKENNIYSLITLHDFYMICPTINMLYKDIYCDKCDKKDCLKCLNIKLQLNNNILENWRKNCHNLLNLVDNVIVPSNNTRKIYKEIYEDLNIDIIEHGVEIDNYKLNSLKNNNDNTDINIAFIGVMTNHKGSAMLKRMINLKKNGINIHLFGKSEDSSLLKNHSNYIYHGQYKREELPNLLRENNISLICIFSTVIETFSYTLTEAMIAKIPVITYNMGAVGERVISNKIGWTIDYGSTAEIVLNKIESIFETKREYDKIINDYQNVNIKTVFEMVNSYKNIYDKVDKKEKTVNMFDIFKNISENIAKDYENYKYKYGHVVHKYERLRSTKIWNLLRRAKKKIQNIKIKS